MTENENKALDLARRVFDHFTRDSLLLAREILALEQDLGLEPETRLNGSSPDGSDTDKLVPDEHTRQRQFTDFPVTDINVGIPGTAAADDAMVLTGNNGYGPNPEDDLPF